MRAVVVGGTGATAESAAPAPHTERTRHVVPPPFKSPCSNRDLNLSTEVAFGVGLELIKQLLDSAQWDRIVSLARRELPLPPEYKEKAVQKLRQKVINLDNLAAEGQGAFEQADVVFCTLGTTRGKAGSAANFVRVDLDYVRETAKLAKEAAVPHFSLLTAQGANPRAWASDFVAFHPLLYVRTKGLAEEAVKQQGFQRVSIFRPGLLDRHRETSLAEKLFSPLVASISVVDVALCMLLDAEKRGTTGLAVFEMKQLLAAAKRKQAP